MKALLERPALGEGLDDVRSCAQSRVRTMAVCQVEALNRWWKPALHWSAC